MQTIQILKNTTTEISDFMFYASERGRIKDEYINIKWRNEQKCNDYI